MEQRYQELCRALHLPDDLYDLSFSTKDSEPIIGFRKSYYRIGRHINRFGKNVLITDNHTWSTDEIVRASLDRYKVEKAFRQSKDDDLAGFMPCGIGPTVKYAAISCAASPLWPCCVFLNSSSTER